MKCSLWQTYLQVLHPFLDFGLLALRCIIIMKMLSYHTQIMDERGRGSLTLPLFIFEDAADFQPQAYP